jgi:hypothetical protein
VGQAGPGVLLGIIWGRWGGCWGGRLPNWGRKRFCGENIWISRSSLDLGIAMAHACHQFGLLKPAKAERPHRKVSLRRGPMRRRKADRRMIRGEAERQNQGRSTVRKSRDRGGGKGPTGGSARVGGFPGAVGSHRTGVVRHGLRCRVQQTATGVAPRSADGFGRTVTRGCVAFGAQLPPRASRRRPDTGRRPHCIARTRARRCYARPRSPEQWRFEPSRQPLGPLPRLDG